MPTRFDVLPIPAIERFNRRFDAGCVTFGVEYRRLNEEIIAAEYGADSRAKFDGKVPPGLPATVDEDGISVHVFASADGGEVLRFDCFDDYPHYHYIDPTAETQAVLEYDPVANGEMIEWVVGCLRSRLGEMLTGAGAPQLAEKLEAERLARVLPAVEDEIRAAVDRGAPTVAPSG